MKKIINKGLVLALIAMMGVIAVNCTKEKKDDTLLLAALLFANQGIAGSDLCDGVGVPAPTQVLQGTISTAVTVSGSAILKGTVNVTNGGSLTVLPKSVIYGERGSSLFIFEGGTLKAEGTASQPICFTSASVVGQRAPGDWGGIVVIGNSNVIANGGNTKTEGTTKQTYPGTLNGVAKLKYVVVEFAGNEVAPGDELNGVSSYAVTQDSSYDYVQIHRPLDDGFEYWGGNINATHLMVTGGLDDDFDVDEGFQGSLTHLIGAKYPTSCGGTFSSDPRGFELDGNAAAGNPGTPSNPTISKFTSIGQEIAGSKGLTVRDRHTGNFSSGLVYGYPTANFECTTAGATGSWTNIKGQAGKGSLTVCGAMVDNAELTSVPVVSIGSIANCGTGDKPDFTTSFGDGSLGGGSVAEGKWWDGWTVYRSK
ncbi:hypothetical protein ND861_02130 [Leptospira sp. 2 VSF19]|uniref:Lipoprotein n=1 Tax=Leptospira soteropolitanensis TaxID=2950025 RepID=A0AAW5VIL6_9LEPT|nr:hypothetical protein [Leptospira soteropolitanensis]MCW7491445.1 hypothetical protein [Leptospira soteropolitanensis]MCW7499029.1 hypothetical protein [Leptospira soteropolitanensis]MCW7521379.1 hypothetical protein [Leptospira soteropolitanensis]MCW7525133.1 hypothetical protein [Leptospira soteropolitanensis]MCW7529000.1 hypothetical protein [Leptospira soteropolitanensis]